MSVVNADGSGLTQLPIPFAFERFVWSPDGTRLALSRSDEGGHGVGGLWILSLSDAALVQIVELPSPEGAPSDTRVVAWRPHLCG